MKIIVTSDIHYGLTSDGDESSRGMAKKICSMGADVLILAGDNASIDEELFRRCFRLFERFPGTKLFIAGNHDLWTKSGDSYAIYSERLEALGREAGFHYLDAKPLVLDGVGFAGSVGWYDYSFKDPDFHVSEEILRSKKLPGYCVWMDCEYIKWQFDDPAFTELTATNLDRHLSDIEAKCSEIVVVTHHLPFEELVIRRPNDLGWSFGNAFMGSRRLGEVLLKHGKVRYAFCGHSHQYKSFDKGPIAVTMMGSNYRVKRFEVLTLRPGVRQ